MANACIVAVCLYEHIYNDVESLLVGSVWFWEGAVLFNAGCGSLCRKAHAAFRLAKVGGHGPRQLQAKPYVFFIFS